MMLKRSKAVPVLLSFLLPALLAVYFSLPSYARQTPQAPQTPGAGQESTPGCPGERMGVQATGVYQPRPVPQAVINGEPGPGAFWEPGMRSYWHCHAGGQLMIVREGAGRVQKRGERMRILSVGDTEYAGPWVEHWHGAGPDAHAHFFQVTFQPSGTFWMEEVGQDDYLGNDTGITSRNEFLRTGVRKKTSDQ